MLRRLTSEPRAMKLYETSEMKSLQLLGTRPATPPLAPAAHCRSCGRVSYAIEAIRYGGAYRDALTVAAEAARRRAYRRRCSILKRRKMGRRRSSTICSFWRTRRRDFKISARKSRFSGRRSFCRSSMLCHKCYLGGNDLIADGASRILSSPAAAMTQVAAMAECLAPSIFYHDNDMSLPEWSPAIVPSRRRRRRRGYRLPLYFTIIISLLTPLTIMPADAVVAP